MVSIVCDGAQLYLPLAELIDLDKELERLTREREKAESELERTEAKLKNEKFVARAPEAVVQNERDKIARFKALIESLDQSIAGLRK